MTPAATGITVHPHACGEYLARDAGHGGVGGSPPRVWGIRDGLDGDDLVFRFTPTRVGNTFVGFHFVLLWTVHPHACGEYAVADMAERLAGGSPPRVWGIRGVKTARFLRWRFTPTRVGNTASQANNDSSSAVHPHACGEYAWKLERRYPHIGSPPRVWGIRWRRRRLLVKSRFTPTRVGNTGPRPPSAAPDAVHPHACGEYTQSAISAPLTSGSPPRVWGIRSGARPGPGPGRFTPTRVGNTRRQYLRQHLLSVHPHACGEYKGVNMLLH